MPEFVHALPTPNSEHEAAGDDDRGDESMELHSGLPPCSGYPSSCGTEQDQPEPVHAKPSPRIALYRRNSGIQNKGEDQNAAPSIRHRDRHRRQPRARSRSRSRVHELRQSRRTSTPMADDDNDHHRAGRDRGGLTASTPQPPPGSPRRPRRGRAASSARTAASERAVLADARRSRSFVRIVCTSDIGSGVVGSAGSQMANPLIETKLHIPSSRTQSAGAPARTRALPTHSTQSCSSFRRRPVSARRHSSRSGSAPSSRVARRWRGSHSTSTTTIRGCSGRTSSPRWSPRRPTSARTRADSWIRKGLHRMPCWRRSSTNSTASTVMSSSSWTTFMSSIATRFRTG